MRFSVLMVFQHYFIFSFCARLHFSWSVFLYTLWFVHLAKLFATNDAHVSQTERKLTQYDEKHARCETLSRYIQTSPSLCHPHRQPIKWKKKSDTLYAKFSEIIALFWRKQFYCTYLYSFHVANSTQHNLQIFLRIASTHTHIYLVLRALFQLYPVGSN